ncbi:MAG: hypothetical protein ACTHN5_03170 [Phycisphaerae bacterium]
MRTDTAVLASGPAVLFHFGADEAAGVPVRIVIEVAVIPENILR